MRLVAISKLKPEMVLARSIYHNDCLVLKEGQTNIGRFVRNLSNMGIEYVYVEDSKSSGILIPDAISEKTRVHCKRVLRQTITDFSDNSTLEITDISVAINSILDEILNNPDVQISLNDISATDEYTFSHSVSTTVYALLIAKQLDYSRSMMEKLAIGTLLHDMGKVLLDKKILFKEDRLSEDEFEYIKKHTIYGYDALKKCVHLTELSRVISLQHHERMDASGYPYGIPAGELHEFARIVAIADVYDAVTTDRCYKKKWSSVKAVNYLLENADTKFDTNLVATFIRQIAIYPNGTLVQLSSGCAAIVKEQNKSMPFRPIVRVIENEYGQEVESYEINLMEELNITILETEIDMEDEEEQCGA